MSIFPHAVMEKSVTEVFGIPGAENVMVPVGDGTHPLTPKKIPGYVFRRDLVREIRAFLLNPHLRCGFALHGHAGCGKSTGIEQFFAYCGLPLFTVVATKTMTKDDIVGAYHPSEGGGLSYKPRSLYRAMAEGIPIFIDEYNNFAHDVSTSLNEVLERRPLLVESTGEVIQPHAGFYMFAGFNHDTGLGLYSARQAPDLSNADRFMWRHVTYPDATEEQQIVEQVLGPAMTDKATVSKVAKIMVDVANHVRKQFVGDESNGAASLEVVLTTRTLVKWAELAAMNANAPHNFRYAFELAFLNRPMPESNREAVLNIAVGLFGEQLFGTAPVKT